MKKLLFLLLLLFFLCPLAKISAATDPAKIDSDGDKIPDLTELKNGYSPYNAAPVKISDSDDDLDGHLDKAEIANDFDPMSTSTVKLTKRIEIDLKKQLLTYFLGNYPLGQYKVSTGKWTMPTPKGTFKIINKIPRAYSKAYGLYMPYWLGIRDGKFGIHELPEWPNGYKEGANHLGTPVSHGCIRLGVGPAKVIYDWTTVGTTVVIY